MWHNIEQNTDEWLAMRAGKITGSVIGSIMANYGKAFGEPAKKLSVNIAVERLTGKMIDSDGFSNAHMDRGHAEEPIARLRYEELYFTDVTNGGFFDNGDTGCSPDGLVSDNGVIEIKSVLPTVHYATIKRKSFDPKYKWQLVFNLRESGRDWIDYISYCSSFPQESNLFVCHTEKEAFSNELEMIETRLAEFKALVETVMNDIRAAA